MEKRKRSNLPDQIFAILIGGKIWGVRVVHGRKDDLIDYSTNWITTGPNSSFGIVRRYLKKEFRADASTPVADHVGVRTAIAAAGIAGCECRRRRRLRKLHGDLWDEVSILRKFVARKCHPDSPLARTFKRTLTRPEDDPWPLLADLKEAKAMFFAQPRKERRRILNRWYATSVLPKSARGGKQVLDFEVNEDGCTAGHDWISGDSTTPVGVQIAMGTTKAEALEALDRVRCMIEHRFETMVAAQGFYEQDERQQRDHRSS